MLQYIVETIRDHQIAAWSVVVGVVLWYGLEMISAIGTMAGSLS